MLVPAIGATRYVYPIQKVAPVQRARTSDADDAKIMLSQAPKADDNVTKNAFSTSSNRVLSALLSLSSGGAPAS